MINTLLSKISIYLSQYLEKVLPGIFKNWWQEGVLNILSFQQRRRVDQNGIETLKSLDLSALLRILDQNWYALSNKLNLTPEVRHFVKEMQTIRNKWAHAGTDGFSGEDVYRDLDTIQRFAVFIEADESLVMEIRAAKSETLNQANEKAKAIDLAILTKEWAVSLKSCEYAGEIIVPEAQLPVIAKPVRRELFSPRRTAETRICLLILAINNMYYEHDEKGFWVHFCNLLEVDDNQQYHSWLGKMLETELLEQGLLAQARQGPFRFVSSLREQCGITKQEIPKFASLLNYLTERYGWEGILVLDREDFNQNVKLRVYGGYLSGFLLDDQGWSFMRDVTRSVLQFRRNILDLQSLEQLNGYRTGFFHDLFNAMDQRPEQTLEHVTRPPLPRLVFLPDFRQLGIAFDQQSINAGAYRVNGDIVRQNPILLESEDMFEESIRGERLNSEREWESWSIQGWIPSNSSIGLFHTDRGYLNHREGVMSGKYYMIAPYQNPPPEDVQLNSYGKIDLPFDDLDYDAWLVTIDQSSNLEFLGDIKRTPARIGDLLSWDSDTNKLQGAYAFGKVFVGKLPPIVLSRPELFLSNAVGIFIFDGQKERRVKPEIIDAAKIYLDVPINTQGRIWVEPINRMREFAGLDKLGELAFCLLPECRITWPDHLHSFWDQPVVILDAEDNDISLVIENSDSLDSEGRKWRVKPGVRLVEGYIKSGNCKIPLAHRIFRADLHKRSEVRTPFFVSSDFQEPVDVIGSGIPDQRVEIAITDDKFTQGLGELGIFNDAGEISFSTFAIRDALAGYKAPVGRFTVMDGSFEIKTDTLLVDCDAVYEWVSNPTSTPDVQWWSLLPASLSEMLSTAMQIREAPPKQAIMPQNTKNIPVNLICLFESMRRSCFVFDGTEFPDRPDVVEPQIISECIDKNPDQGKMLAWFVRAKQVFDAVPRIDGTDADTLLVEYSKLSWQPPFQRWKDKVNKVVRHLKADVEVLPLLAEWKKDVVERGYRTPYTSRIASQTGGRELTHAWVSYYRAGNFDAAVNKALTLLRSGVSSPTADLAAILVRLCWLRLCCFKSQEELKIRSSNKKLQAAYGELCDIIGFADWTNKSIVPAAQNLSKLAVGLPITIKDQLVLDLFAESEHDRELDNEKDWLMCYCRLLLARAKNMGREAQNIAKILKDVIVNVPASPDKSLLIEITEKYL